MKKISKKRSIKKAQKGPEKAVPDAQEKEQETEKPFDFGGLPDRDLKKNLGCG